MQLAKYNYLKISINILNRLIIKKNKNVIKITSYKANYWQELLLASNNDMQELIRRCAIFILISDSA